MFALPLQLPSRLPVYYIPHFRFDNIRRCTIGLELVGRHDMNTLSSSGSPRLAQTAHRALALDSQTKQIGLEENT